MTAVTAGQATGWAAGSAVDAGSRWLVRQNPPWQASRYAHARAARTQAATATGIRLAWHTGAGPRPAPAAPPLPCRRPATALPLPCRRPAAALAGPSAPIDLVPAPG